MLATRIAATALASLDAIAELAPAGAAMEPTAPARGFGMNPQPCETAIP